MLIYIPTRGRPQKQTTLYQLTPELRQNTILVTDYGLGDELWRNHVGSVYDIWEVPRHIKGIAYVRQYIMDNSDDPYLVMLDDDLKLFSKRPSDRKILAATEDQVYDMFNQLAEWLKEGITHCSITPRFLNWNHPGPYKDVCRMMHVLAYDRDAVAKAGCEFTKGVDNTFSMDDFHMTLQLLRAGRKNRVDVDNCTGPSASNSKGGASDWRTVQTHNKSAHKLKELHPDFVRVSAKQQWRGMDETRYDVTVQWQKAYNSAKIPV